MEFRGDFLVVEIANVQVGAATKEVARLNAIAGIGSRLAFFHYGYGT